MLLPQIFYCALGATEQRVVPDNDNHLSRWRLTRRMLALCGAQVWNIKPVYNVGEVQMSVTMCE
jgi:hypothetical protein